MLISHVRNLLFASLMLLPLGSVAQQNSQAQAPQPVAVVETRVELSQRDPQIADALKEISPERIKATIEKLVSFKNRNTLSSNDQEMISQGLGVTAAAKWIEQEFQSYSQACAGCLQVKTDSFTQPVAPRVPTPTPLTNVYAILQGSDPENAKRIYLVTGHFDSRNSDTLNTKDPAPGANDDASGTAVSLECARVLSKYKFPATLIFLTVAGEEQGLDGAKHFAQMAREQHWNIEAVLNNDIVGGNTTPGDKLQRKDTVRVFSEGIPASAKTEDITRLRNQGGENDSTSRELARYIRSVAKQYQPETLSPTLIFRRDRFLRGGDHTAFNEEGFAGVRFTEYREDFHHQHQNVRVENGIEYGDVLKFVDFDYVAKVARTNAATLASLASAPAPPANVRIDTRGLTNDTTLTWEPSPGGLARGYQILWRDGDQPYWQHAMNVPSHDIRITLPISKDNVIFAIRAIDAKDHASLPVVPRPSGRIEGPGTTTAPASSGM
ncbi:MAG TPA: M28 family metallopeptidase [Terriglobales bacterium]|nr:M28 family metallopeptidase [Terriglobales bacterium]